MLISRGSRLQELQCHCHSSRRTHHPASRQQSGSSMWGTHIGKYSREERHEGMNNHTPVTRGMNNHTQILRNPYMRHTSPCDSIELLNLMRHFQAPSSHNYLSDEVCHARLLREKLFLTLQHTWIKQQEVKHLAINTGSGSLGLGCSSVINLVFDKYVPFDQFLRWLAQRRTVHSSTSLRGEK